MRVRKLPLTPAQNRHTHFTHPISVSSWVFNKGVQRYALWIIERYSRHDDSQHVPLSCVLYNMHAWWRNSNMQTHNTQTHSASGHL